MTRAAVLLAALFSSATAAQAQDAEIPPAYENARSPDASLAGAQDSEIPPAYANPPSRRGLPELGPFFVEVGVSVGGPAGWVNGSLGVLPTEWLDMRIGLGIGASGLQAALGVAAHVPLGERVGIGVEVGPSIGPYEYKTGFFDFDLEYWEVYSWDLALWANAATSVYTRLGRDFRLRIYAGYGRVLNPDAARCLDSEGRSCTEAPSTNDRGPLADLDTVFFGAGLAYAFGG